MLQSSNSAGGGPGGSGGAGGAPSIQPGATPDGQGTPSTNAKPWDPESSDPTKVPKNGPTPGTVWGNADQNIFSRFEDEVVLTGNGSRYTVHQYDGTLTPDEGLSVLVDFSISDATLDTLFTVGLQGTDGNGQATFYGVRLRSYGAEVLYSGPHGSGVKRVQFRPVASDFYRLQIDFYGDAAALYLGNALAQRMDPSHAFLFPVTGTKGLAKFNFLAEIFRGQATVRHVEFSRSRPGVAAASLPTLARSGVLDPTGRVKTMTTSALDLGASWDGYSTPASGIDPLFYVTTFDGAPNDVFYGTNFEWSYLGGRTTEARDQSKILRFHLNTLAQDGKYGRLAVSGVDPKGGWYYHSLIFSNTQAALLNYAPGYTWTWRWFNTFLLPMTDYVVDFVAVGDGTALYVYPEGAQPPAEPQHVFLAPLWSLSPQALIYQGAIRIRKFEVLTGGALSGYPSALTPLADDAAKHPSMWVTRASASRYVTYQVTPPADFGVQVDGSHVHIAGTGDYYETYAPGTRYARDPASGPSGLVNKGLRFEFKVKTPGVDQILHLAIEGYSDKTHSYRRHAIVVRNNQIYAQFMGDDKGGWGSRTLAGPGAAIPYDPNATYVLKLEAYKDGSALYLWKKGDPEPTEPEHVLLMADFNVFNWHSWIWRDAADFTFSEYDLSADSVLKTYAAGDSHTTWVTGMYNVLGQTLMETTADGAGPLDKDGNFVLTGSGHDWSASVPISAPLSRARKFHVNIKVKVDTAVTNFSGMHFALHGYAPTDANGSTYRRHAAVLWTSNAIAQSFSSGIDDWRASTILNQVKPDTWYDIQFDGNSSGSALTIWEDGQPKPKYPQSIDFNTDWQPMLNIWLYNGRATFKDFTVTHELSTVPDSAAVSPYSDLFNLTHQRFARLTDYMGAKYLPGQFAGLGTPAPADTFAAVANLDLGMDSNPCWRNLDATLGQPDAQGFSHLKGDGQWYWEGATCVLPLARSPGQSQAVTFELPSLTYDVYIGLRGNAAVWYYRTHMLRLAPAGAGRARVIPETYTTTKGWVVSGDLGTIDAGGLYKLTMSVTPTGSTLTLERLDGDHPGKIGTHSFTKADDPGASDWDPYFYTRVWSDDFRIKKMESL